MIVSQDFEIEVLKHLYHAQDRLVQFAGVIEVEAFQDPVHAGFWRLFKEHYEQYQSLHPVALEQSIVERFALGPDQLFTPPEAERVQQVWDQIVNGQRPLDEWVEERLIQWIQQRRVERFHANNMAHVMDGDLEAIHEEYRRLVNDQANALNFDEDEPDFFTIMPEIAKAIHADQSRRISTGIPALNAMLGGGLYRGEFGIFWGPPNIGKSMMIVQIGYAAITSGHRVLHVTTEMSKMAVYQRYVARFTEIDKMTLHEDINTERVAGWQASHGEKYAGMLDVRYLPNGATVNDLWRLIKRGELDDNPYHLVIVDYIDMFEFDGATRDMGDWLQLEKLFQQFHTLCKPDGPMGTDTCIFAITHATAEAEGKKYANHQMLVRAKTSKSKVVDFSIFMGADKEDKQAGRVVLSLQKIRDRPTDIKSCRLMTRYDQAKFLEDNTYEAGDVNS